MAFPPEEKPEIDALMDIVRQEAVKRRRAARIRSCVSYGWGALVAVLLTIFILRGAAVGRWDDLPWQIFNMFSAFSGFGAAAAVSKAQREATEHLAKFEDPRIVGPLAEGLWSGQRDFTDSCRRRLIEVLPLARFEHRQSLSVEQKQALSYILRGAFPLKKGNDELVIATLRAMEQIGDEAVLPLIRRLASLPKDENSKTEVKLERIRSAARECLPFVERLAEEDRARSTLLRPATPKIETLLRPAHTAPSDPQELLRPADLSADTS